MGNVLSALHSMFAGDTGDQVHFHRGPDGNPAVCDDARCDRPQLSID